MAATANRVRIIGGRHRGRRLHFSPGPGLRPTPDRVRETLFNWLQGEIHGARCLDLFAGSGVLGLEALSRGAAYLLAIESNRRAAQSLRDNVEHIGESAKADVRLADALRLLKAAPERPFDLVFVDPPFASTMLPEACRLLEQNGWLGPEALVYLEQDAHRPWPPVPPDWTILREGTAGQSAHRLLRRSIPG